MASTAPVLDPAAIEALVSDGTATAGMIAKLRACEQAIAAGVRDVVIVDGRDESALEAAATGAVPASATRIAGLKTCGDRLSETGAASVAGLTGGAQDFSPAMRAYGDQPRIDEIQAREARHVLQTYKRLPITFVRGQGVRLYDAEGREYLDLLSGIGVASLGHAHPGLARAIADQAQTLIHTSNLFYHPLQGQLAERLAQPVGAAARLFLQQRHRGGGSLPEVRAALLAQPRRAAGRNHRARELVPRTDVRRAVGDVERALPRAVRAAAAGRPLRAGQRSEGACWPPSRDRRRRSSRSRCRARAACGR